MRSILAVLFSLSLSAMAEPTLLSATEKEFKPEDSAWAIKTKIILFEWSIPDRELKSENKKFLVIARRSMDLERQGVQYWSAWVSPKREDPVAGSGMAPWYEEPQISRTEFVTIVAGSEAMLRKKANAVHFNSIYVGYHTVEEHELELTPKLRKILADTKGEVEFKHRGIMRGLFNTFASSPALASTAKSLKLAGLNISTGGSAGDYYTPVDRDLATTWAKASLLKGFGLTSPPLVIFFQTSSVKK